MIKLVSCDCIEGLYSLKQNSYDVIVTSPPYNLGIDYSCSYDDSMPRADYLKWIHEVCTAMYYALSESGSLFLNVGSKPTDPCIPFDVLGMMLTQFKLQNTFHWIKSITVDDKSYGHYKPINSPRFVNDCHEYVFHLTKKGDVPLDRLAIGVPYADKSNEKRWDTGSKLRCRGNNWYIPYQTIQNRDTDRPHPATFPVEVPELCFLIHGLDQIKRACDPFVGIGSSAIAAKKLGIPRFVGIDLNPQYIEVAQSLIDGYNPE